VIPARRLVSGARIEIELCDDPAAAFGGLSVLSSDGFIQSARLVSDAHLRFNVAAAVSGATTLVRSPAKPSKVLCDSREETRWSYDESTRTVRIPSAETATIDVFAG
jgi:hypothetical protein